MMKVIAEPARSGSSYRIAKGEKVRLQRDGIDAVLHEGMGQRWNFDERNSTRNHLNALRRYLRKQVGRRWDTVYSDICHNAPKGSFLGNHVRELVADEVHDRVTISGDEMYGRRGWKVYTGDLYVCPETNILKVHNADEQRKRYRYHRRPELEMIGVDETHKYVNIDGLWFFVTLSDIPGAEVTERPCDVVFKESVFAVGEKDRLYHNRITRIWNGRLYASTKRQANSREVRDIKAALSEGKDVIAQACARDSSPKRFVRRNTSGRRR